MFTGIVEETGRIVSLRKGLKSSGLSIKGDVVFEDMSIGDSISVNGVCLTVTGFDKKVFDADVMSETLKRSSLSIVKPGSAVNLERAMRANGRFGGHIVSGHIDGTGKISEIRKDDNAVWYKIQTSEKIMRYIIEKGSIAIDGISLTVATLDENSFSVSTIPHTIKSTVLCTKAVGDIVNLENDMMGKYAEKLLNLQINNSKMQSGITAEKLRNFGF